MIARRSYPRGNSRLILAAAVGALLLALACGTPAVAAETNAHWNVESRQAPENLPPGGEGMIIVTVTNLGDSGVNGTATGSKVTISDALPAGTEAKTVQQSTEVMSAEFAAKHQYETENLTCPKTTGTAVECTYTGTLAPYELLQLKIPVKVSDGAVNGAPNVVTVSGGDTSPASATREAPVKVGTRAATFGVESFEMTPETESFEADSQAGSHPFQMTTTFNLNQGYEPAVNGTDKGALLPTAPDHEDALVKNLTFKLPPGLIGNVNAVKPCSDTSFGSEGHELADPCPNSSVIGVSTVTLYDPGNPGVDYETYTVPLFDLEPAPGEPARFGFSVLHVPVVLHTAVRTGEDYGVTVGVDYASQTVQVVGSKVTFWGIPGDARHNESRGWQCLNHGVAGEVEPCGTPTAPASLEPYLLLPTKCAAKNETTLEGEAWNASTLEARGETPRLGEGGGELESSFATTGCSELPFEPKAEVTPDTTAASTPSGLGVTVSLPQGTTTEPSYTSKAEAAISSTKLELPDGWVASAGAANGLATCAALGREGIAGKEAIGLKPGLEEQAQLENTNFTLGDATCPESSKIGTVSIKTPLLERELTGGVYLAEQDTNPFASPLVLYLIAEEKAPGEVNGSQVLVKLAGEVTINPTNGQLISDFRNTPQSPFETLKLHLTNGPRASQATPARCGSYPSVATFASSSNEAEPDQPSAPVESRSEFQVSTGPGASPCPGATLPFQPSFQAESTNPQAGAFSPFRLLIQNSDGDAALKTISMQLPPGVAALLGSVPLCPEPQAAQGTCSEESRIGESVASSGLGSEPVRLPGKVYLTGPYNGAPFGLASVTEANAGPFRLGRIVVRSSISVNEVTAAATINTENVQFFPGKPVAGEQTTFAGLPEMLKGVPAQLKSLEVTINRPNFEFNPTSCEPTSINGTLTGYEGTSVGVSSRFQVANCGALPFAPKLTASVQGHATKPNGTTFIVTVESAGVGQANIHKVDLTLPEVLPSRLTTIQKACLAAVFEANPASCDEGSVIGEGIVHTPVFKNPLRGPAYLVSHGSAAFPDVEFVLQGEGIKLILDGKTDIKKGITYSKFETAPDAPFTTFETVLPAGPHSALTADVPESEDFSLCKTKPVMPTVIVGQNGATIEQTTKIALIGCGSVLSSKVKKLSRAQMLAKALKACRTKYKKKKSKRLTCEKQAHKKYGPKPKPKKKTKKK
jgi:hypothetical protein